MELLYFQQKVNKVVYRTYYHPAYYLVAIRGKLIKIGKKQIFSASIGYNAGKDVEVSDAPLVAEHARDLVEAFHRQFKHGLDQIRIDLAVHRRNVQDLIDEEYEGEVFVEGEDWNEKTSKLFSEEVVAKLKSINFHYNCKSLSLAEFLFRNTDDAPQNANHAQKCDGTQSTLSLLSRSTAAAQNVEQRTKNCNRTQSILSLLSRSTGAPEAIKRALEYNVTTVRSTPPVKRYRPSPVTP
jgi:hypothetical protein